MGDQKCHEELCCIVNDALKYSSLDEQAQARILVERVDGGASPHSLLVAALSVIRSRDRRIAKLRRQLDDLNDELERR
jgi:hypothetical protein